MRRRKLAIVLRDSWISLEMEGRIPDKLFSQCLEGVRREREKLERKRKEHE